MDSYRLTINNYDLSTSDIEQTTDFCGYTVIDAPKGPATPIRISANGSARIQDLFGVPTKDYPEIYEAISFNNSYDLYVSAPYEEAEVPYAVITSEGIFPVDGLMTYNDSVEKVVTFSEDSFTSTATDSNITDITLLKDMRYPGALVKGAGSASSVFESDEEKTEEGTSITYIKFKTGLTVAQIKEICGETSESITAGTFRIKNFAKDSNGGDYTFAITKETVGASYWKIVVDKSEVGYLVDDANAKIDLSETNNNAIVTLKIVGSADGNLTASEVQNYAVVSNLVKLTPYWVKTLAAADDKKDIRGYIFPKYPSERTLHVSFSAFNALRNYNPTVPSSRNILKMSVYEEGAFHDSSSPVEITGSLDSTATDASGSYLGFTSANSSFADQDLIFVYPVTPFTDDDIPSLSNISQYAPLTLSGGKRTPGTHETGWEKAKDEEYARVNVFFDSKIHENKESPTDSFLNLKDEHPLAGYIFNQTVTPTQLETEGTGETISPLSYGENYWNVCNEAIVNLSNTGKNSTPSRIYSAMTGTKAAMQCRIMENRYGGVAPMFLNSGTPSMGGQLTIQGLYKMRYKYNKAQQERLDELNYNPVIQDYSYGAMSIGQKTCKTGEITDWSYIGHVCSFLVLQREIKEQVMIPQLGKPNNPYYRELRAEQVQKLLTRRLEGNNRIWAEASVDTSTSPGVNDVQAQKARKFVINVKVKVDIYSEYVTLNFTNVAQDMSIE